MLRREFEDDRNAAAWWSSLPDVAKANLIARHGSKDAAWKHEKEMRAKFGPSVRHDPLV